MGEGQLSIIKEQLSKLDDEQKKEDCFALLQLMTKITGEAPKLWRGNMIGFGTYRYKYNSGREGEWFLTGFCPRKNNLVVYIVAGFKAYETLLAKLGKYKTGSSCLYLNSLRDVDPAVLSNLISLSVEHMRKKYMVE
ncbi:MAG: DUF1801 domain-containing protein [Bacteroidota bacterium]